MLAQRTLKMPSETDKIYVHKVLNPLFCNVVNGQTHLLQDFQSVSDHSTTPQSKGLSTPGLTRLNAHKPVF